MTGIAPVAESRPQTSYDAVLLVSFGGPEGPDDVIPFLERVTAGRGIPRERLEAVGAHYAHFGGVSPINEQCRRLRTALREELRTNDIELPVYWGNRNWHPLLAETVAEMAADGVQRALAVVTSAYSSYSGCRQYREDIEQARREVADRTGRAAPAIDKVRAYHDHPGFVEPFADAVGAEIAEVRSAGAEPHVVTTAHSIPEAMAAGCDYEAQLRTTAALIMDRQDGEVPWSQAWQSRSGPPSMPWLEPDINDHLRELATAGVRDVVLVPIGFVSDHIEVAWDLDNEAAATARECGIRLRRAATPGTDPDPRFVTMWRELIEERLDPARPRLTLGPDGPRPDVCPQDCCGSGRPPRRDEPTRPG